MGAIIGGLYAAGWSPGDMEELVQTIDWENIFTDRVDRRNRSFRRKQDDWPVMIRGRLHFDGLKPVMPSGVIDGQRLELMLRTVEALSPATGDFDDLPIRFRAVAASIATGRVLGRWGEIRISAFGGEYRGSPRIGLPGFPSISETRVGGETRFRIDTVDSVVFPTSGSEVDLRYSRSAVTERLKWRR
jgi:hypothetical protein